MDNEQVKGTEDTADAIWCVDSESSEWFLLDRKTGFVIARKDKDGNILYSK